MNKIKQNINKYWILITFCILILILFFLNPDIFKEPYIMMEDGPIFINGALHNGFKSIFETYGGYLYVLPRLVAIISVFIGKLFNSSLVLCHVSKFISIFLAIYVINYFNTNNFKPLVKNKIFRFIISILILLMCSDFLAVLYCSVSLNWIAGIYIILCSLQLISGTIPKGFNFVLLLLSILTTPVSCTLALAMLIYFVKYYKNINNKKDKKNLVIKTLLMLILLFVQGYSILFMSNDIDNVKNTVLTLNGIKERVILSLKLSLVSINFIFGNDYYKVLNNLNISSIFSLILWLIITYSFIKHNKSNYLIYIILSIFIIYFMTLYKRNDYYEYALSLMDNLYNVWYNVIPSVFSLLIFSFFAGNILSNNNVNMAALYCCGIIALSYFGVSYIKNYCEPDLSYTNNIKNMEKYTDFKSKYYNCVSIPPSWVDWCVDIPVNERYCEDYECD